MLHVFLRGSGSMSVYHAMPCHDFGIFVAYLLLRIYGFDPEEAHVELVLGMIMLFSE
jgi:hypothetical protein